MANTNLWRFRDDALALVDVARFEVRARDGSIGTVVQTIRRDGTSYLVVDPGASMPLGRSVLVPAGLIETIDVDERRLDVRADRDQVSNAPEHDAQRDLDARTRGILERHYAPSRNTGTRRSSSAGSRRETGQTKAELYEQAKRLGIEGRSKMSKAELARAVARRSGRQSSRSGGDGTKANPVEVQSFLEGVGYPTRKQELVREAERHNAPSEVRATLRRLPDKKFDSPTEVSEAIGSLG
jgi:Protein of unknown function (DUF2795)